MEPRSGCPINAAVEVLGDRWSLLVLRDVIFGDRRYFRALLTGSIEGIDDLCRPMNYSRPPWPNPPPI
ncbi:winged helix-turn-helix transcriptional regulator [Nonomuraea sp. M3C6]|uniref:Winged helix-turn-helix transcriptional regulator n=1 Tax=Nonomuraea marmarensis TaxID=3351344 RepID=A0ABW7ALL4_9ACTN